MSKSGWADILELLFWTGIFEILARYTLLPNFIEQLLHCWFIAWKYSWWICLWTWVCRWSTWPALTLPMLWLLSSMAEKCKNLWKPSKPCCVGNHWNALAEFFQMSTHLSCFQSFFSFFASFCIGQISQGLSSDWMKNETLREPDTASIGLTATGPEVKWFGQYLNGFHFDSLWARSNCLVKRAETRNC